MKSWFAKFRMSCALDEKNSLAKGERRPGEQDGFESRLRGLDEELRTTVPASTTPSNLHQSIMRSVRRAAPARSLPTPFAWVALSASAALAIAAIRWVAPAETRSHTNSLATATSALNAGAEIAHEVPSTALAPLSDELTRLDQDMTHAKEVLLSSLP